MITVYNFSHTSNTGDRLCSPHLYFDWLKDCEVKAPWEWNKGPAIFGAGGLLHPGTDHLVARAIESGQPTVVWGIGLNYHGVQAQLYPKFLDSGKLVGLREKGNPWRWAPCPSCMAKEFDEFSAARPVTDVVIYEHGQVRFSKEVLGPIPAKTNEDGSNLKEVLEFLASGRAACPEQ